MSIEQTLEKVEQDIASKNYGKARDRLHGLIVTYPGNLTLRKQLGDIYWKLHYPAMAGRYWYLEQDKDPNMVDARRIFERSCGNKSFQILHSLKFRGTLEDLDDAYARDKLQTLQSQVKNEYGYAVDFRKRGIDKYHYAQRNKVLDRISMIGCGSVGLVGIVIACIGLDRVISWIF